ncbi:unnamed protein product (mitochondrion) [Plasmodiophora brassicae]|uniref:Maf-like protein n=1 Tax=Plasmodiophora brassicae TaxID=37360 RepID=A0A0G4IHQ5_PLABS|nr:hypothetical protein PBRA_003556 [Plasmodiophora brassicae]SPQ98703.1 unnamed protein product [Plasmodiophora brassicae]
MALRVILGSSSPIRARLLSEMTSEFVVRSPDIDEAAVQVDGVADRERSDPTQLTLAIARAKSDAIRKQLDAGERALVVTMDSLATYDGVIRGKPTSRGQCRSWMMEYMVKPVHACTAVVVYNTVTGAHAEGVATGSQLFHRMPDEELTALLDEQEILTCAGGYIVSCPRIQRFLSTREGSLYTLMGFPRELLSQLLDQVRV